MVIYFTEEDLVSFGEYMVSPQRRRLFEAHPEFNADNLEEMLQLVHDADLSNWAYSRTITKQVDDEIANPNSIN